jgi:MFS family permease
MLRHACVLLPSIIYAIVFNISSPALSLAIPSAYAEKFDLNAQEIGLQFLAMLIGAILGEVLGGRISDSIMNRRAKIAHGQRVPEFRLWISYLGFICVIG